jgi:hypothetical protein
MPNNFHCAAHASQGTVSTLTLGSGSRQVTLSAPARTALTASCSMVMEPTFSTWADPLSTPAAFFSSTEAGGVFKMKVNDLSWEGRRQIQGSGYKVGGLG